MGGLSRRQFLSRAAVAAAAAGIALPEAAPRLATPVDAAEVPSTLGQTIRLGPVAAGGTAPS